MTRLNENSIFKNFAETNNFSEFVFDIETIISTFNRNFFDQFILNRLVFLEIFQDSTISRRMFFFDDEIYDDSLYYFRLFKSSNFCIRLFDSIDIQNTIEKIIFQKN